jgi:hypothetical protein
LGIAHADKEIGIGRIRLRGPLTRARESANRRMMNLLEQQLVRPGDPPQNGNKITATWTWKAASQKPLQAVSVEVTNGVRVEEKSLPFNLT